MQIAWSSTESSPAVGGKDGQRRREMVREIISILPEAQRRALMVDNEITATRNDQERSKMNGYPEHADVDMGGSWVEVNSAPTEPRAALETAKEISLPPSPAPQPHAQQNSPFYGPPCFSNSPAPTTMRVLSGSPFNTTANATASSSKPLIPKPKAIINDDANPVESLRRSTRAIKSSRGQADLSE